MSASQKPTQQPSVTEQGSPLQYIKGIGPKRAAALNKAGIKTPAQLILQYPLRYIDRRAIINIADIPKHMGFSVPVTVIGSVVRMEAIRIRKGYRKIFRLVVNDSTGFLTAVWFEGAQWLEKFFTLHELVALSAKPTFDKYGRPQLVHPEIDRLDKEDVDSREQLINTGHIIPHYSTDKNLSGVGLDSRGMRKIIRHYLFSAGHQTEENLPSAILAHHHYPSRQQAIRDIHFPQDPIALEKATIRLKYEEFFFTQVMVGLKRIAKRQEKSPYSLRSESPLVTRFISSLPFELTNAQKKVIREISSDMVRSHPMNRLLQGDVGSGKTVVAIASILLAVDNSTQAAFMVPTELLAEQQFTVIREYTKTLGVRCEILTSSVKGKKRTDILTGVKRGEIDILVGTQALIQQTVDFKNLSIIIIDEQHRFGVMQRLTLHGKGVSPHTLVMTATPIPRSLALTLYGDLEVSMLDELPAARRPIITRTVPRSKMPDLFKFLRNLIQKGRQVYYILPIIEESETLDLASAKESYDLLSLHIFPDLRVGLIHGKLHPKEKDAVMEEFKGGKIDILVATTVIEVGIDVPNTTVIVIENAFRYGLSQLHQLRGRVGRGREQSYCFLIVPDSWETENPGNALDQGSGNSAQARIEIILKTLDGFEIADADLRLRGPGELLGVKQSGLPEFKIADLRYDQELLLLAHQDAMKVLSDDPHLTDGSNNQTRKYVAEFFGERLHRPLIG